MYELHTSGDVFEFAGGSTPRTTTLVAPGTISMTSAFTARASMPGKRTTNAYESRDSTIFTVVSAGKGSSNTWVNKCGILFSFIAKLRSGVAAPPRPGRLSSSPEEYMLQYSPHATTFRLRLWQSARFKKSNLLRSDRTSFSDTNDAVDLQKMVWLTRCQPYRHRALRRCTQTQPETKNKKCKRRQ